MPAPKVSGRPRSSGRQETFPWALWLLLLGSIYVFWVLPRQLPQAPVKAEFGKAVQNQKPKS